MVIKCKKTGEEYAITDREIGEKIECPCCGEKFLVDDKVLPRDAYEASLIRKTEAIVSGSKAIVTGKLYVHDTESEYERLFDRAYSERNLDAQLELAKRLCYTDSQQELARFWFRKAADGGNAEAEYWMAEWHLHKNEPDSAMNWYEYAAKDGCNAARKKLDGFKHNEYNPRITGGGKAIYESVLHAIGRDKKYEEYLCGKYDVRAALPFWSDAALPEWGLASGASYIIGSFKEEKEVPRELLNEISQRIGGRRLVYSGRYVDDASVGDTKFLFCYAIWPAKNDPDEEEEVNHISDLLQWEYDCESGEVDRMHVTWHETIDMNCPLCEAKISVPNILRGSRVRCSHCKGEFLAKVEGIMTTEERKRYLEYTQLDIEAAKLQQRCFSWSGSGASALRIGFKMKGRQVSPYCGNHPDAPWKGLYITLSFEDGFDIKPHISHLQSTLESIVGFLLRRVPERDLLCFYVRQDRPCKQDKLMQLDSDKWNETHKESNRDCEVSAEESECRRITYLLKGDDNERVFSRNYLNFIGYLSKKYGYQFGNIMLEQLPLCGDVITFCVGQEDAPPPDEAINEVARRIGYSLKPVFKADEKRHFSYSLVKLRPSESSCIGKGTGVDWSRENAAFARFADEYGISGFKTRAVNPYCMEVSIPLSVGEDDVRDFANDLFDELGLLSGGDIDFHQFGPCCFLDKSDDCYYVVFNHHSVVGSKAGDADYKFDNVAKSGMRFW